MSTLLPAFERYPEEGRILGELVVGYGELELSFAHMVAFIAGDHDVTFKALYRARGEEQRINIGDALARPRLTAGPYRDHYDRTVSAMRHCTKIRNLFAHCQIGDDAAGLWFVALEENAKKHAIYDLGDLTQYTITLPMLQGYAKFFEFTKKSIEYLNFKWRHESGSLTKLHISKPREISKPRLPQR